MSNSKDRSLTEQLTSENYKYWQWRMKLLFEEDDLWNHLMIDDNHEKRNIKWRK